MGNVFVVVAGQVWVSSSGLMWHVSKLALVVKSYSSCRRYLLNKPIVSSKVNNFTSDPTSTTAATRLTWPGV